MTLYIGINHTTVTVPPLFDQAHKGQLQRVDTMQIVRVQVSIGEWRVRSGHI